MSLLAAVLDAETTNNVLNLVSVALLAVLGKVGASKAGRMEQVTTQGTDRIVERLESIEHRLDDQDTKLDDTVARLDRLEGP